MHDDRGDGGFIVDTVAGSSAPVSLSDSGEWMTATVSLPAGSVPDGRFRVSLVSGSSDLVARLVRVIGAD